MARRGFESFVGTVDSFVKEEFYRQNNSITFSQMAKEGDYEVYRSLPPFDTSILSTIRDIDDGVMYFMVGVDRVGRPAKIGA